MARGTRYSRGPVAAGSIRLKGGVELFTNADAPTDGTSGTGAGFAARGSICWARDTGIPYSNVGTTASPTWIKTASGAFPSASASKSPSASASPS